ncbi:vacuolar sorting protein VPS33/slp1 [Boothiomyces macroporosus]|uniref:Vacuolar sorting protein VPS33/slp1 n=1 Tax=Boothiomyces macroporosus TaxID=261099 RepID=A0AAD5UJS4_9FUNG|nr:vacuolar sorting protein VPS33/slp1 [Boothiomyces macroporosus]
MIKAVQPAAKWKLLVVDANSAKLLNTICKSHDILQENVTVIEDMSQKRQPYPNYEAIYFVTPTAKTIDRIIADFKQEKPSYLAAHIFFISGLDEPLFDKIKKSGISKFIKSLKEMNVDFMAMEEQIFSFDMPLSLFPLYNPTGSVQQMTELSKISKKLLSLLITLGDSPFIRCYDPNENREGLAYKLGQMLQNDLDQLEKSDPDFPLPSEYRKTILIIIDRTFDMMAPFLHEFTYQAMMNDLICGDRSKHPEPNLPLTHPNYFSPIPMYLQLDETDTIWLLIRHWHFAEAVDYILNNFQKFLTENKAAGAALGNTSSLQGIDALKQMKDTLSSLPQFQALKAKFSIHINVAQECKVLFERRNLDLVASVQQDLATGETADGKSLKNAMLDLIPVLDNKNTTVNDKLRALIVYIIAMNGIQDMERQRLLSTAKVSPEDSQGITNLSLFDVKLSSTGKKEKDKGRYSYWGSYKQERKKRNKKDDSMPYDLSRYVPIVKRLIEDQINNSVPKDIVPWIKEPRPEDLGIASNTLKMFKFTSNGIVPPDPNYPNSLRTTRASWAGRARVKTSAKAKDTPKEVADWRRNGSRIILFSLGGLTYSEVRSCYEISKESQREIFMGSTFVYNPIQFLDVLKELHKTDTPALPASSPALTSPAEPKEEPKEKKGLFSKKK